MKKYGKLAVGILVLALLLGGSAALYRNLAEKYRPNALKEVDKEEGREEGSEGEGGAGITGGQDAGSVTDGEKDGGTAGGEQDSGEKGGAADESMKAPDFTVRNAAEEEVKLSDFAGKPVILNFWASWCGPCKSEMPYFQILCKFHTSHLFYRCRGESGGVRRRRAAGGKYSAGAGAIGN